METSYRVEKIISDTPARPADLTVSLFAGRDPMDKPLSMICITHMFIEMYLFTQVALIPVFIQEFQLGLIEASLVATVPSLTQLLANIPSGFLTDRFEAKHLLFSSMMIEGFSALLLSRTDNFFMLVLGVSVMRASSPLYHVSGLSQISDISKRGRISRSMGFHNAFGSVGSTIGLVTLTVSLSTLGWRWTYLSWAVPILAWGLVLLRSPKPETIAYEKRPTKKIKGLARLCLVFSTGFLVFLAVIGFREVGVSGSLTFMTTYLVGMRGLSEATAAAIFGLGPFVGIVGSVGGGYLGEKTGAKRALSLTIIGCVISLSVLAFLSDWYLLVITYVFFAFFINTAWAPMNSIVADTAPQTEKGLSFSVFSLAEGIVASITPIMFAAIIGLLEIWYIFPVSIVFLAASLITLQFLPHTRIQL